MGIKSGVLWSACASAFLAGPALAGEEGQCVIFFDKQEFESFNANDGKFLKGVEDFEESNIPDGLKQVLPAPLKGNEPNVDPVTGFGFPSGLTEKNIIIQDNVFPGPNPPTVNPSGNPLALFVIGSGFIGSNSKKVGEDLEVLTGQSASIDLLFTEPNHTGVGFELSHFTGFGNGLWHVTVYNKNDDEICKFIVNDPGINEPSKIFVGVWTPQTIGRINIWDEGIIPDAIDNIQLWEEQLPTCPWDCGLPHNKKVDIIDFLAILSQWGLVGSPCDFGLGAPGVGINDFLKLLSAWGPCPTPANDECPGDPIDRNFPVGNIEVHFDMYGATPSLDPHSCFDIAPVKDIWYCLTYQAGPGGPNKLVKVSTSVPLLIEVTDGCTCPPGQLLACGFGSAGTPQFLMHPTQSVTIRLSNQQNLPNDLLKGLLFIDNKAAPELNVFTDPASFQVAVQNAGKTQKFFWNFKPHSAPTFIPGLNDPLDINTHAGNAFDPWTIGPANLWPPFVDNVQFTSNTQPQGPLVPQGAGGLAFIYPGNFPVNNNALVSNFFINSFDIISGPPAGDNHTAIAFEVLSVAGPLPTTLHVTVYDKADLQLAKVTLTYDGGKRFLGFLSKDPDVTIGRIDIWDPNNGAEGISSLWTYSQAAGLNFYLNEAEFFGAVDAAGKGQKFFWNFKPDYLMPGAVVPLQDPLDINTHFFNAPNVWFQPGAINLWPPQVDNVQFWSNANPQGPLAGGSGLFYYKGGPGLPLQNNALVARPGPTGQTSFDILSGPPAGDNHTAFGLELISLGSPVVPLLHVTVYDKQEVELGKIIVPPQPTQKVFLGMLTKDPAVTIGRIDIWDTHGGQEGISAIAAYAQNVCTACNLPAQFIENETCGGNTNGGCNIAPPLFEPAACDQTWCGTSWAFNGTRDTDWYLVNLADSDGDGVEELRATLNSEFPGVCFIVDISFPACAPVVVGKIGCSSGCVPLNDAAACLPAPGTYVVFVAPGLCSGAGIFDGFPCDVENDYRLSIQCNPCPPASPGKPIEGINVSAEAKN